VTRKTIVVDTETYPNSFLLAGKNVDTGKYFHLWLHESGPEPIRALIENQDITLVTFNGRWFDLPVMAAAAKGLSEAEIKELADSLIEERVTPWVAEKALRLPRVLADHVDIKEVAPSFVSLKAYGARMHMPWLKDLPYHHMTHLTDEQRELVLKYCYNDLDTTEALMKQLDEPLKLRVQMSQMYGVDMRSKSDTQMAEAAFVRRLKLAYGQAKIPGTVSYKVPHFVTYESPHLNAIKTQLDGCHFSVNRNTGHVVLPEFLDRTISVGDGTYKMGVGGLHSTHDKSVCHLADKEWGLTDIDAASYYPSILILCDLIPQNTGRKFIDEYRSIYNRRLAAKKSGDKTTANTLKISLNGTFGKTAAKHSPLYSPDLMIAITLTGQLTLLVLIERFVAAGFQVVSANTDGIAVRYPHKDRPVLEKIVDDYSKTSGFEFEYTPYRVLALKDVNNYVAITPERKVKAKGLYAPPDLRKNPSASVVAKAVAEWLSKGVPFEDTVRAGKLVEFLSARSVTGGAVQGEEYLGKVVRWYQTTDRTLSPLTYAKNGNKVPKTDGARAFMLIEDYNAIPDDLDYQWYIIECVKVAKALGCGAFLTEAQHALDPTPIKKRRSKKNDE
jgi:DNA polymerase elongation subunit (family B)